MASPRTDLEIEGRGFYAIFAVTLAGRRWMKQVEGFDGNSAYSDDSRMTQDIADGAIRDGLSVSVNGRQYIGAGRVAS
jgi:hypothetical protein